MSKAHLKISMELDGPGTLAELVHDARGVAVAYNTVVWIDYDGDRFPVSPLMEAAEVINQYNQRRMKNDKPY